MRRHSAKETYNSICKDRTSMGFRHISHIKIIKAQISLGEEDSQSYSKIQVQKH